MFENAAERHIKAGFMSALEAVVCSNPAAVCIADSDKELTYSELWSSITKVAQGLASLGVAKGDRVVFLLPNCVDFMVLHLAIIRLGAVSVPIDLATPAKTVSAICASCSPGLIVASDELNLTNLPDKQDAIPLSQLLESCLEVTSVSLASDNIDVDQDLTSIMFTSGSTGEPKGVKLTHRNNLAAIRNIINYCEYTSTDFEVVTLPLTHSFGLGQVNSMLLCGGGVYMHPACSR